MERPVPRPTIRTLTLGVPGRHPLPARRLAGAAAALELVRTTFIAEGYEVQTVRLTTTSLPAQEWDSADALDACCARLQSDLDGLGIGFCSVGAAPADDPAFALSRLD